MSEKAFICVYLDALVYYKLNKEKILAKACGVCRPTEYSCFKAKIRPKECFKTFMSYHRIVLYKQ